MFNDFSEQFFRRLTAREYRLTNAEAEARPIAETPDWTVWKTENAGLCFVRVIDCNRVPAEYVSEAHAPMMRRIETNLKNYSSVYMLYVLVSDEKGTDKTTTDVDITAVDDSAADRVGKEASAWAAFVRQNTEEYCGQRLYAVFWQVRTDIKINLKSETATDKRTATWKNKQADTRADARIITVPKGQPSELFGLSALIRESLSELIAAPETTGSTAVAASGAAASSATFGGITQKALEAVPFKAMRTTPYCTYALAVINAVVMLLMYLDGYPHDSLTALRFGALMPSLVLNGEYYRLITCTFVHFGVGHFAMNAVGLVIFGTRVERYYGRVRFMILYFISGLSASVLSLVFTRGYAAGASGAIYGLVGAAYAYTRVSKRSMDKLDAYLMLLYIGIGLAMGFAVPNIDNAGHIGGLLAGLALGAGMALWFKKNKRSGLV